MSDEEGIHVTPREQAPERHYGESLLYDFSKFLITLPLLMLGAMLTLAQAARAGDIKLFNIILVLVTLSTAAVVAFSVAHSLVDARSEQREPRAGLPKLLKLSTALLGVGVGQFVMMWIDTLS